MSAASSRYDTRVSSRHDEHSTVHVIGRRSVAE
jgi:hypothetical protein